MTASWFELFPPNRKNRRNKILENSSESFLDFSPTLKKNEATNETFSPDELQTVCGSTGPDATSRRGSSGHVGEFVLLLVLLPG